MPPTILGPANQKRRRLAHEIALTAGIVTAIFALFIALVLVVGHVQLRAADPLNSVLLQKLRAELAAQPDNEELREQIRTLDLLARRAYFANVTFLRNGLVLLLAAGSIAVIALGLSAGLARQLPRPSRVQSDAAPYRDQQWARWILGISAATTALLVAVLIATTGPPPYLTQTRAGQQPPAPSPSTTPTPAVEPEATSPPSSLDILRNWPNFRGPCGNGVAFCTNAPTQWDVAQGIGIVWKRPVPRYGTSSPIVWGKRLFLTGGDAERREVFCYDAETGTLLWRGSGDGVPGEPTEPPEVSSDTGHAAPTPATDGRRVFAIFATGNLLCYDFDGRRLWARNLGPIENHYGHASSLLVHEGRLIVQLDQSSGSKVLAFEAATGKPAWESSRWTISWASPICVDTGSRTELILADSKYLSSYDPTTGTELWRVECLGGEVAPSPAYAGGTVFAAQESVACVAVSIANDEPSVTWRYDEYLPDVASPLATPQYVFLATSRGVIVCLDAQKGTELWRHEFGEGFYASPILVGNLVYALDRKGTMRIFEAAPTLKEKGNPTLSEPAVATPAFVEDRIFVRTEQNLYCIGQ